MDNIAKTQKWLKFWFKSKSNYYEIKKKNNIPEDKTMCCLKNKNVVKIVVTSPLCILNVIFGIMEKKENFNFNSILYPF